MLTTIASFEHAGVRHLILAVPTDRTGTADTFCGRHVNRVDGYCYVGIPTQAEVCSDCSKSVRVVVELLDRSDTGAMSHD